MRRLLVISFDAMVCEDLEILKNLPAFGELMEKGALVEKGMRSIYPSLTYPVHTSILTGCRAGRHGIINNSPPIPGNSNPPWFWFHEDVKTADLHDITKAAGMSTASVFWPVTGAHPSVDYLVPEYWPQKKGETFTEALRRSGSSDEVLKYCVEPYLELFSKYGDGPEADKAAALCACEMIRRFGPKLLTLHVAQIDARRHSFGIFNDKVSEAVLEAENILEMLMEACRDAGVFEETNFVVLSDHGQLDYRKRFNANRLLIDAGLVDMNAPDKPESWKAWVNSACLSAHVFLSDPADEELKAKVYELLLGECGPGKGIERIFSKNDAETEGLFGDFSFVLEAGEDMAFTAKWDQPLYSAQEALAAHSSENSSAKSSENSLEPSTQGLCFGNHGHHPDKGPQPVFLAMGPQIREGARLDRGRIIDEAPTMAAVLGLEMPSAEGRVMHEILN